MNTLGDRRPVKTVVLTAGEVQVGDVVFYESPAVTARSPKWREVSRIMPLSKHGQITIAFEGGNQITVFPYAPIKVQVIA